MDTVSPVAAQFSEDYEKMLRQLSHLNRARDGEGAEADMLRMQYNRLLSYKLLQDATLLHTPVLTIGLKFSVFLLDWLARVCAGTLTHQGPPQGAVTICIPERFVRDHTLWRSPVIVWKFLSYSRSFATAVSLLLDGHYAGLP